MGVGGEMLRGIRLSEQGAKWVPGLQGEQLDGETEGLPAFQLPEQGAKWVPGLQWGQLEGA